MEASAEAPMVAEDGSLKFEGAPNPAAGDGVRVALRELLGRNAGELVATLQEWDTDGSGAIEKREFIKAFNFLGSGSLQNWAVDTKNAGLIFDELDRDNSGYVDLKELKAFHRDAVGQNEVKGKAGGPSRKSKGYRGALPTLTLDVSNKEKSISAQLGDYLRSNRGRVLDLFRSWDEDEGGSVSLDEFRRAMKLLGVEAHQDVVDDLFTKFDTDRSG